MPLFRVVLLFLAALLLGIPSAQAQDPVIDTDERRIYAIDGEFGFYREMVESAITDQGLVVNYVGHIATMLDRTGGVEPGAGLYRNGESLEFCSATYSRRMMEADPHSIVFCPYVIAVYELTAEPGTIHIGYQRVPIIGDAASQQALQDVEDLIERIIDNAMAF